MRNHSKSRKRLRKMMRPVQGSQEIPEEVPQEYSLSPHRWERFEQRQRQRARQAMMSVQEYAPEYPPEYPQEYPQEYPPEYPQEYSQSPYRRERPEPRQRHRAREAMRSFQESEEMPQEVPQEYPQENPQSPRRWERPEQRQWLVDGSQEYPQEHLQSPHRWVRPEQRQWQWQIDRQAMRSMQAPQEHVQAPQNYPRVPAPEEHWRGDDSYYWSLRNHSPVCGLPGRRNWCDIECVPRWRDFQPPYLEYPPNSPPGPRPYGESATLTPPLDHTAMWPRLAPQQSNAKRRKLSGTNLQHPKPNRTFKKVKRRAQPNEKTSQQPPQTHPVASDLDLSAGLSAQVVEDPSIPCFEPDDLLLVRPEKTDTPLPAAAVCETPVVSTETSCKHEIKTESETEATDEITETQKTDLTALEIVRVSVKSDAQFLETELPIVDTPASVELSTITSEEKFSLNQEVGKREEVSFSDSTDSLIVDEKTNLSTFDNYTSICGNIHDRSNHDTSETQRTVICSTLDHDVKDNSSFASGDQLLPDCNDLFSGTDRCSISAIDDPLSVGKQLLNNNVPHMADKELIKCDTPNACEKSDSNPVQYSLPSPEPVSLSSPKHSSVFVDLITPPHLPSEEKSLSNDELEVISQLIDLTHSPANLPCDEVRIISIKSVESAPDALPVVDLTTSPVASSSNALECLSQRLPVTTALGITPIPLPNETLAGASALPTPPPHAPLVGAADQQVGRGRKRAAQEDVLDPSVTWKRPRLEHGGVHIPLPEALNKLCTAGSVVIYKTGTILNEQSVVQRSWALSCQFSPQGFSEPPFRLVDLPFESSEFKELQSFFHKTSKNKYFSVERIQRIENVSLINRFREKVQNLERRCGNVAVVRLFHGTLKENISSICLGNLDLRLAGTSTSHTWWGAGVNFSPISFYASHYGDQGRLRSMLVCEVAVGNVCSLRRPKTGRPGEGYDTNIKLPQPQVVCKFDDDEFYPSYVIDYVVPANHQGLKYDELMDFYGHSSYNFDEYYGNNYNFYYD